MPLYQFKLVTKDQFLVVDHSDRDAHTDTVQRFGLGRLLTTALLHSHCSQVWDSSAKHFQRAVVTTCRYKCRFRL
jgi:hypothetical protein